jgi:phosphohistidine phosphatase SixA
MRLLLVRHARAGARGHGASDLERPLDARGLEQAAALPALLGPLLGPLLDAADDGAPEIRTSPARRCVQTVEPLGAALGVDVVRDDALLEGCDVLMLHGRIASLTRPTVWSSHGDVIPELLMMLARRGLDLGDDPRCRKGSTWVIDVASGEAVSARYLPPPI